MRHLFLSLLALALTLPALSQAKHPFTFEDMMKLKRLGEPEVSPDGKWVIFSVVDVNLEANTKTPHIWIVPLSRTEEKSGMPHVPPPSRDEEKTGVPHVSPNFRDMGTTERELIPDQACSRPPRPPDPIHLPFPSSKPSPS